MLVISLCAGSCAVQFFVKQIADTATDGHSFVPVVACIDAPNAVRADLGLAALCRQWEGACLEVTVAFDAIDGNAARLGATVVGKGQVGIEAFVRRPRQCAVDGVFRHQRQWIALIIFGFVHVSEIVAPLECVMQRNHQVAFDTRNSRFRRIFPLQKPVADIAGSNDIFTNHDFVTVRIMEIGCRSLPAVFVELKANLFIDTGFRFQISVAHVVAADTVRRIERTSLTACVQDKVGIGLIQVWRFVRTGNTAFNQPVFADLMREVQSRTPVAAAVAVVVETDGRNQMGFVGQ